MCVSDSDGNGGGRLHALSLVAQVALAQGGAEDTTVRCTVWGLAPMNHLDEGPHHPKLSKYMITLRTRKDRDSLLRSKSKTTERSELLS